MRFTVLILLFFSELVNATSLVNRYQYSSTGLLPTGVWTFGVSHGQSVGSGGSFSNGGQKVSNQDFFSKDITYSNLLDEIKNPLEKDLARAAFEVYERNDNENAGTVINDVSVSQKSNAYFIGRGLSKKSNLFIIFPIVTIQTEFSSEFRHGSSLLNLAQKLRNEGQFIEAHEIIAKSQDALRKRLDENGYRSRYPRELTTLANIHLNHRYAAITQPSFQMSADSTLILPAGKRFDEDDFLYYKIREEQVSFRQNLTGMLNITPEVSILPSLYYQKRFAFEEGRRIPNNSASPLSEDIDPNTRIKYGDSFGGSLQINYVPLDSYVFYLGQSYEQRLKDSYSGSRFSNQRYDYLAQDTDQTLGIGYFGVALNTIEYFLSSKFPAPLDLNLQYSFTNFGKNTFNNQALAMNLMVFYK